MSLLQNITSFDITPIETNQELSSKVLGYYVTSTATINVEDKPKIGNTQETSSNLQEIAKYLINSEQPELVLHIHGYSVSENDARNRYKQAYDYALTKASHFFSDYVFIGYRWPAESLKQDNALLSFLEALPTLPLGLLISSLIFGFVAVLLSVWPNATTNLVLTSFLIIVISMVFGFGIRKSADAIGVLPTIPNGLILVFFALLIGIIPTLSPISKNLHLFLIPIILVSIFLVGFVAALIALRFSNYPRDRSRASNYGVLDLVSFFQYLEQTILDEYKAQQVKEEEKIRIKTSFIAHSLGCEVATQVIRILSDVFDPQALSQPTPNVGNVFSLNRLVLVAADIPLESILSSRSNYLKSSLRRCEEAYVFSNEADLALRLASTAANYFSFPFKTRFRGYKLGNLTFNRQSIKQRLTSDNYGIVNCEDKKPGFESDFSQPNAPHKYLEIRASEIERKRLIDIEGNHVTDEKAIADYFTYFDCTDYQDDSNQGLLSFSEKKSALNLWFDYMAVSIAYFFRFPRSINVHGGYFNGIFSGSLINDLAFVGYKGLLLSYLETLPPNLEVKQFNSLTIEEQNKLFNQFSQACQEKYIQVILASKGYEIKSALEISTTSSLPK